MTEQAKRTIGVLCWILIVIALVIGFVAGYTLRPMIHTQPKGDCVRPDTMTVYKPNISQSQCTAECPECLWIVRSAQ